MVKSIVFSVVMPVYNGSETLEESVSSVLNQTFDDFELIIVNDCSTDGTSDIVARLASRDGRIVNIKLSENEGVAHARNRAIELAVGRYICFLDADDTWLPEKLEKQLEAFSGGALVVCSSYFRFRAEGGAESLVAVPAYFSYRQMLSGNMIGNLTGAYDSWKLGKFYQKKIGHEDYLMWLRVMAEARRAVGIAEPLARYRVGAGSLSGSKIRAAAWTWHIFRKELNLSIYAAVRCFVVYSINALIIRVGSVKEYKVR
ncbi:MAG: glycosyltransferase family 2 protein [Pseudomonas profundi]|uniref:glycosyltransferase family 2 protein n=1 Tax=Pseudomonas profundi TaxID=1981513 RepID=UPI0030033BA6